jgi:hypothetical protein
LRAEPAAARAEEGHEIGSRQAVWSEATKNEEWKSSQKEKGK